MLYLFLISFLVILISFHVWLKSRKFSELRKVLKHDILTLPLIGISHMFFGNGETLFKGVERLGDESLKHGGMIAEWLGPEFFVCVADPELANIIAKECLDKHEIQINSFRNLIGNSQLIAPVPLWHQRRKIASPLFNTSNLRSYSKVLIEQSDILVKILEKEVNVPFLLHEKLLKCTKQVSWKLSFNDDPDFQNCESSIIHNFEECSTILGERLLKPWLYNQQVFKLTSEYTSLQKHKKLLFEFVCKNIAIEREIIKNGKDSEEKEAAFESYIRQLIMYSGGNEKGYTDQELCEEVILLILAAADTTTIAAAICITLLARFPEIQEKLYQEVKTELPYGITDIESLLNLKYLSAVVKETLRLFPPIPIVARKVVNKNIQLPNGVVLPEGCGVVIHLWAINRNKKYWGPDADKFRPERFLDPNFKHAQMFGTFSFGPRNCTGYRFAMLNLRVMLASLISRFQFLPVGEVKADPYDFKLQYKTNIKSADGNPIIFKLRN